MNNKKTSWDVHGESLEIFKKRAEVKANAYLKRKMVEFNRGKPPEEWA